MPLNEVIRLFKGGASFVVSPELERKISTFWAFTKFFARNKMFLLQPILFIGKIVVTAQDLIYLFLQV